jgi:hypothetical protein
LHIQVFGFLAAMTAALMAHAAPRDPAAAQALFDEGMALIKARDFAKACPKLAESQRLDPGIGTQFHLADCYENQGLIASAWAQFLEVASLAMASAQTDREQLARKRAERLEPRLPRLRIVVPAVARVEGLYVERDDVPVGETQWDTPLPADPGEHEVAASAPGFRSFTVKVRVQEGRTTTIEVPPLMTSPVVPPAAPSGPGPLRSQSEAFAAKPSVDVATSSSSGPRPLVVVLGVAGIAGLAVGTTFGLVASSKFRDSKAYCTQANEDRCSAQGVSLRDSSITLANVSTVGFIAGGAALVGVGVIWLAQGRAKPAAADGGRRLTADVQVSPSHGSIVVSGRF